MGYDINLKVIDLDFNFLGEVDDYSSVFFIRKWHGVGEFQLSVENLRHIDYLKTDNIVLYNPSKPYIIENIEIDTNKETMIVKGRELKSILDRRTTIPPAGQGYDKVSSNVETIIKGYVDRNCVTTTADRIINNLVIAPNLNKGISTIYQTRYKPLSEEVEALSLLSGLGYTITLDIILQHFGFEVLEGKNKAASQSILPPAIFSTDFDNIITQKYNSDEIGYKNYGYVGGQGEEEDRRIVEVQEDAHNTGIQRREIFIDARDINEDENLTERGKQKLSEYTKTMLLDTTVSEYPLIYEKDWDLGDIVTIREHKLGLTLDTRIVEVTENYDRNGYTVNPIFGNNAPTFANTLKKLRSIPLAETKKEVLSAIEPSLAVGDYWDMVL